MFLQDCKIVILVYSVDDEESFNQIDNWFQIIKSSNDSKGLIFGVIANKSDLASDKTIPDERGIEYANKIDAIFKSTSAKNQNNDIEEFIDQLFDKYHQNKLDLEVATASTLNRAMIRYSLPYKNKCC